MALTLDELEQRLSKEKSIFSFVTLLYIYLDTFKKADINKKIVEAVSKTEELSKIESIVNDLETIRMDETSSWIDLWINELHNTILDKCAFIFHTLSFIDGIINTLFVSKHTACTACFRRGPMSKIDGYSFYYKKPTGYFSKTFEKNNIRIGRQITAFYSDSICNDFKYIQIVKDSSLHEYCPVINYYRLNSSISDSLKIGIIPICSSTWFKANFDNITRQINIAYYPSLTHTHNDRILALLSQAEQQGANIIIFPELSMNKDTQIEVIHYLQGNNLKNLKLCFLGSFWNNRKNESVLLSGQGSILANQFKKIPYKEYNKACGWYYTENLDEVNNNIAFVDIEGIGRIAYLICADINDEDIKTICNLMQVDMIFVSAFTNSTDLMEKTSINEANQHGAAVVICNSCAAIDIDDAENNYFGLAVLPKAEKKRLIAETCLKELKCSQSDNCNNCIKYFNISQ